MYSVKNKLKIRFLIFLAAFLLSTSFVFGQNGASGVTFYYNENQYSAGFQFSELQNTPSWNPEIDYFAPLSVQSAISIAREKLKQFIPSADNKWSVKGVTLTQEYKGKWIYLIQFYCSQQGCVPNSGSSFSIMMKMDGTIIEPTIKPFQWKMAPLDFSKGLNSSFDFGENEYRTKATVDDLKDTPSWNPEKEYAAPLPIQKAIEIGREKLSRFKPTANNKWSLKEILFDNIGNDKWIYEIDFDCIPNIVTCRYFQVYIKMDGTIIEPIITAKKEKEK